MDELIEEEVLEEEQVIEPEVVTGNFRSPFGGKIGVSSVDLSDEKAEDQMLTEYNEWWRWDRNDPKRGELRDKWTQTYHGMPYEQYDAEKQNLFKTEGGFYPGANNLGQSMKNAFEALSIPGLGWADFFTDAAGTLVPGADKLDDRWDEATKLDSEAYQQIRGVLSIVLPAIQTGGMTAGALGKLPATMPWFQKALIGTGAFSAQETALIGLSDIGEEHNFVRFLADTFPGMFGSKGRIPFPDAIKTLDGDSPYVRKKKNMYETAGLSVFGTILGAAMYLGKHKGALRWLNPVDDSASKYKQLEILNVAESAEPDKLIRLRKIEEILSSKKLSKQNENILINEKLNIEDSLGMSDDVDGLIKRDIDARAQETDAARARRLVDADPNANQLDLFNQEFDPDITPGILDESGEARQTVPPANVARNIADTTAIKSGVTEGDPAPIITEAMRSKGLMVGPTSRGAVMGVAEETRDIGRFDALVDGFRFSTKQMNAAAWDIYTSIIDPGASLEDIKSLFYENRDVTNMLMGRFKVESINEEQARAAAFAMRDLVDRFLGREVSEASARAMDTIGREASTMAQAIKEMTPYVDDNRAMDLIIDKMEFLLDEYALNKYISGWRLRNKNWFDQVPPKELDTVIEQLTKEFTSAENAIHAKNMRFTQTLKELKKNNPGAMRPLVDAFAHTNGDVDSLAKLYKWAAQQITPMGLIKSPDPKQLNLFARGAWGVRYNNVLSGLSAARAAVGNGYQLIMKPMTAMIGHGLRGDIDGMRRTIYYNSAVFETNRRALGDALSMMKKAHKNPDALVKAYRKDFIFQGQKSWNIMNDMEKVYEAEGNWGRLAQLKIARGLTDLAGNKALRYGMTGLVFPDAFTATHLAHYLSRARAYDDVISEFGYFKPDAILKAEKSHYATMFDTEGLPKDAALKNIVGEVSLNLDDGLANYLNKGTTAFPILKDLIMFPRTASNMVKNSLSWTPISSIPGINKYATTIYAQTDEEIAEALFEHGIDMANTPNAKAIFENLRAEYIGRQAFSGLLVGSLFQYSMAGNIRGNGHYNASRRKKERDQMGYEPKTINIGGKWVSYKGLLGVEQVLSIIGDLGYYRADLDEALLENWGGKLSWTIAATFLNETPLEGLEPLIAALNGDLSGWNRLIANSARSYLPMSGGAGVLANAISSSQKDINGEIQDYIKNRLPGFNHLLPEQIDIWTGDPLNDIDNPFLRVLNAVNPIKISGTAEPWRQWLLETNWDGISMIRKHSSGSYEYSPKERELIYKFIGEQKMYKKLERLMKSGKYKEDLRILKLHRHSNADLSNENIKLKTRKLPLYQEINKIVKDAQKVAEIRLHQLAREQPSKYGHIPNAIIMQQLADKAMTLGQPERAINIQQKEKDTRNLLQMRK